MSWEVYDENGILQTALAAIPDHTHTGAGSGGQINPNSAFTAAAGVGVGGTGLTSNPSNGQLLIGNGTGFALATITADEGITITNGAGSITIRKKTKFALLREQLASGNAGGTSTANAWTQRNLSTEVLDADNIVSLSSNRFTPIAGSFRLRAESPFVGNASNASGARIRLYNHTAAAVVAIGVNLYIPAGGGGNAFLEASFDANGTDAYQIEYYITQSKATNGLGAPLSIASTDEYYTQVLLEKV